MEYQNDINEITSFAEEALSEENEDYEVCLKSFTMDISEEFLLSRAQAVKTQIQTDERLQQAFRKLAVICNGKIRKCLYCPVNKYCNSYIKEIREKADRTGLQMVDLFCGAGGLSLGFIQEGFITALANDIEACCVDTYAHNHPETPRDHIVLGDIRNVVDHLEELLKGRDVNIVIGGPPCQGFSMANRQRLIDDPRNYLYKNFVKAVSRIRPEFLDSSLSWRTSKVCVRLQNR